MQRLRVVVGGRRVGARLDRRHQGEGLHRRTELAVGLPGQVELGRAVQSVLAIMARMKPLAGSIDTSAPAGPVGSVLLQRLEGVVLHAQVEGGVDLEAALEGLRPRRSAATSCSLT